MDSEFYTSNILANVLVPFKRGTYADRHRFCQDNDPKHKSKYTQQYMKNHGINWWNVWPSGMHFVYFIPFFAIHNRLHSDIVYNLKYESDALL